MVKLVLNALRTLDMHAKPKKDANVLRTSKSPDSVQFGIGRYRDTAVDVLNVCRTNRRQKRTRLNASDMATSHMHTSNTSYEYQYD